MGRVVTPVAVDFSLGSVTGYGVSRCLKVLAPAPLLIVPLGLGPANC